MKRKLSAQIIIVLLLATIFSVLPVTASPPMFSVGKVNAIRLDVAKEGPGTCHVFGFALAIGVNGVLIMT